MAESEGTIYIPPNIRTQALETLQARIEQRRARRLMTAIELNQTRQLKMRQKASKESEKFGKSVEKASKIMDQVAELLGKAEGEIRLATALHNSMVLLEEGSK